MTSLFYIFTGLALIIFVRSVGNRSQENQYRRRLNEIRTRMRADRGSRSSSESAAFRNYQMESRSDDSADEDANADSSKRSRDFEAWLQSFVDVDQSSN